MGRDRYKTFAEDESPYFITCTVVNWIPVFSIPAIAQTVLDSLQYLIDENSISIHGYVIMENHIHMLLSSDKIALALNRFKSFTARKALDYLTENDFKGILKQFEFLKKSHKADQEYQFWQEGYHPKQITDKKMCIQKLNYIHYNPVRRGFIESPEHWRYSSYGDYYGKSGLLAIDIIPVL